jgi:tetratricopeptide (TPR) repeat protein
VTHHYVDCYRFRGEIPDGRGDWPGAQKAYADAVALAPDLPAGYYSWGVALAKHRHLLGAEAKLKDANQKRPHWADPLKVWGDVLVKQGNGKDALAKYDERSSTPRTGSSSRTHARRRRSRSLLSMALILSGLL